MEERGGGREGEEWKGGKDEDGDRGWVRIVEYSLNNCI